jgi:cation:H+ antiporter
MSLPKRARHILWLLASSLLALQWIVLRLSGAHLPSLWAAVLSGVGIFGAAVLLSWAAEVAQVDIPQSLALAFLALIAVLPEYAVDLVFAWKAGSQDAARGALEELCGVEERCRHLAIANMTGANRLLIGLGWSSVVLVAWWRHGARRVVLEQSQALEMSVLLAVLPPMPSGAMPTDRRANHQGPRVAELPPDHWSVARDKLTEMRSW